MQIDPLERIMASLRDNHAVDPNRAAARKAQLKAEAPPVGGSVPQMARPHPVTGAAVQLPQRGTPTREEGVESGMTVPQTTVPIIIDALNESIIALKVELHRRGRDPETRKRLERMAEQLRNQILELGGEPIWADESVEDGIKKLRGVGYAAKPDYILANQPQQQKSPQVSLTPTVDYLLRQINSQQPPSSVMPTQTQPVATPKTTTPATTTSTPKSTATTTAVATTQSAAATPGLYAGQVQAAPPDYLSQILSEIGVSSYSVSPPPTSNLVGQLEQLIEEYGLRPRTQEEIEEHARAIVERATLERTQIIQREIDRFQESWPNEFAKAQENINKQAAQMKGEQQAELAAMGSFYSSVMANRMSDLDETVVEKITEISMEAARYVNDLERQITDIEQMAVLEQTVLAHQMMSEERQFAAQLAEMQMQVALYADQLALDAWYKQGMLDLQQRELQLQEIQFKIQEAERYGQHLATAFMADHPMVQSTLLSMGISPDQFGQMPIEQQSYLVRSVVSFNEIEWNREYQQLQMQAILHDMAIKDQQVALGWAELSQQQQQLAWAREEQLAGEEVTITSSAAFESALGALGQANDALRTAQTVLGDAKNKVTFDNSLQAAREELAKAEMLASKISDPSLKSQVSTQIAAARQRLRALEPTATTSTTTSGSTETPWWRGGSRWDWNWTEMMGP